MQFSSVQSLSHVQLFATLWIAACQASLSITNSQSLLTHVHHVGDAIQPSHPLLSPSLPTFSLFQHQGLFHWVNSLHQVAKVLELQLQYQSFQWIFRTDFLYKDWLDLLAVPGTLKSLLQHHSSKAPILWHSAFFIVQLSHLYMTTGKTIDLTKQTFNTYDIFFSLLNYQSLLVSWKFLPPTIGPSVPFAEPDKQ